ncbi:MAG: S1 family peptidase [Chitinophagaceae bacterium]
MKKIFILLLLCAFFIKTYSQSLTKERIQKLKTCVGKISIEGSPFTGTGFLISEVGNVLTCWHVVAPSLITDTLGHILDSRKVFIEFGNGVKFEISIPAKFVYSEKLNQSAVSYDYCILVPTLPRAKKIDFIKLGSFQDINEGDEVYTAGYPLGISNQFISKGILSTKYIDSSRNYTNKGLGIINQKIKLSVALLDLTINKGNSGGPIIKIGKTPKDDQVVGIANFTLNPLGSSAEQVNNALEKFKIDYKLKNEKGDWVSLTEAMKVFSQAIIYSSNGISGCVSINHFLQATQ